MILYDFIILPDQSDSKPTSFFPIADILPPQRQSSIFEQINFVILCQEYGKTMEGTKPGNLILCCR